MSHVTRDEVILSSGAVYIWTAIVLYVNAFGPLFSVGVAFVVALAWAMVFQSLTLDSETQELLDEEPFEVGGDD